MGPVGYRWMGDACRLAEDCGFDFVAVGNHRFSPDALDPSAPFVLLSALASQTTSLIFMTTVLVLPLYHPLDIAEQVATLDCLSNGRVIVGVGLGYRPYECEALGIPYERRASRAEEAIDLLYQAWGPAPVTFSGRHFQFHDVDVVPKPAQRPHPSVWIGGQTRGAIERAGRLADGLVVTFLEPHSVLGPVIARYRKAAEQSGRGSTVCLMRKVGIRAHRRAVEDEWLPGAVSVLRHYRQAGGRWRGDRLLAELVESGRRPRPDDLGSDQFVMGNPDDCFAAIQECEQTTGCEYLLASFGSGPVTTYGEAQHAELMAAIRLFGEKVIPNAVDAGAA